MILAVEYKYLNITFLSFSHGRNFLFTNLMNALKESFSKKTAVKTPAGFLTRKDSLRNNPLYVVDEKVVGEGVDLHFKGFKEFDKSALFYLRKTLELCASRGIKVVTVETPKAAAYLSRIQMLGIKDKLRSEVLNDISYQSHIFRHLDCVNLYSGKEGFFDPSGGVLNSAGREDFSKFLSQELN